MGERRMAKSRGVAILVGAGDAIGAAVARRFASGWLYSLHLPARRRQVPGTDRRVEGRGPRCPRVQRRRPSGSRSSEPVCRRREEHRADRGLPLQCRIERQQAAVGHHREAVLQGVGTCVLRRVSGRPRGCALHASAWPRHDLLYRSDRQHSWRHRALRRFHRRNSDFARWPRRWRANSGPRISTSCIS